MTFTLEEEEFCLKLLNEISEHPISSIFKDPVDPINDDLTDYFDFVKNPSDLSTVRKRLLNKEYNSIQEFKRDMNLIWENAIAYNGRQSSVASCAEELSKIFQKRIVEIEEIPIDQWINDYLKNRSQMCKLFRNAPKGLTPFTISTYYNFQGIQNPGPSFEMSSEEVQFFESNQNMFQNEEVKEKIEKLLLDIGKDSKITPSNLVEILQSLSPSVRNKIRSIIEESRLAELYDNQESSEYVKSTEK